MKQIEIRTKKIEELLNSSQYNGKNFYDLMQFQHNNTSEFNNNDYTELIYKAMYLYHQKFGIEKLMETKPIEMRLPFSISKDITYENFVLKIEQLKNYPSNIKGEFASYYKNYYDFIIRAAGNQLIDFSDWSWTRVYAHKITKEKSDDSDLIGKIYLSLPNKHLHKFANLLLEKCTSNKILDYQFKIHNDDKTERKDSIVIYFTKENFAKYIKIIQEIKQEEPSFQFNAPNFLAHQYNEYIAIAKDPEHTTFSNIGQMAINIAKNEGKTTNKDIAIRTSEIIESYIERKLEDLVKLCEETKKILDNKSINSQKPANDITDIFITYNLQDELAQLEMISSVLIWEYPYNAPYINISPEKKSLLIAKGQTILNNDILKIKWTNFIETLPHHNGYLVDETLHIMTILKEGVPLEQVKEILQGIKDYDLVLTYLSNFIKPEILKKINPKPSFSK